MTEELITEGLSAQVSCGSGCLAQRSPWPVGSGRPVSGRLSLSAAPSAAHLGVHMQRIFLLIKLFFKSDFGLGTAFSPNATAVEHGASGTCVSLCLVLGFQSEQRHKEWENSVEFFLPERPPCVWE